MDTKAVVYVVKERVKIVREVRMDYLVEDLDTGKQYLIDQSYFRRKYVAEAEHLPIHTEVWEKLENQAYQLHQLKRANNRLRAELRSARRAHAKLQKEKPEVQHYRNGQKRGRTRNG